MAWCACATASERGKGDTLAAGGGKQGGRGVAGGVAGVVKDVMIKPALDTKLYGFPLEQSLEKELYEATSRPDVAYGRR